MLISFSGLDGAGKTTQIKLLLNFFEKRNLKTCSIYDINPTIRYHSYLDLREYYNFFKDFDVIHLRFRLNSDENSTIMEKLEYSEFGNFNLANLAALQGFYDYYLLEKYVIIPLLKQNKIIISDRHYFDEIAFKTVYGCNFNKMCKLYSEIDKPNLAFYLKIPATTALRRNLDRPDGKTTLYQNIDHIKQLIKCFDIIKTNTSLIEINGENPLNIIHSEIISYMSDKLLNLK